MREFFEKLTRLGATGMALVLSTFLSVNQAKAQVQVSFEGTTTVSPADTAADPRNNFLSNFNFTGTDVDFTIRTPDFIGDADGSPWFVLDDGLSFGVLQARNNRPKNGNNDGLGIVLSAAELSALGFTNGDMVSYRFNYSAGQNYDTGGSRESDADSAFAVWIGNGTLNSFDELPDDPDETVVVGAFSPTATADASNGTTYDVMPDDSWRTFEGSLVWTGGDLYFAIQAQTGPVESGFENIYLDNIIFGSISPPIATPNSESDVAPGTDVTIDVVADDIAGGFPIDATSVSLVVPAGVDPATIVTDADGDVIGFRAPGEGDWSVNPTSGAITFMPLSGVTASPTAIEYSVADTTGFRSDPASVTITYTQPDPAHSFTCGPNTVRVDWPTSTISSAATTLRSDLGTNGDTVFPIELQSYSNAASSSATFETAPGTLRFVDRTPQGGHSITLVSEADQVLRIGFDGSNASGDGQGVSALNREDILTFTANAAGSVSWTVVGDSNADITVVGNTVTITGAATAGSGGSLPFSGFTIETTGPVSSVQAAHAGTFLSTLGLNSARFAVCSGVNPPPVVEDDTLDNVALGTAATVNVLANDSDLDGLDATSVSLTTPAGATDELTDAEGNVIGFTVPNEGTWRVDEASGAITFDPEDGFLRDPTPVTYTVADTLGNRSDPARVTITYTQEPGFELVKSVVDVADVNGNGLFGDWGDVITYDFTVTNTGTTSLAGLTLTDDKLSLTDEAMTPSVIAPGETATLAGQTYTVGSADIDSGEVENTATATGTPSEADGTPLTDAGGTQLPDETDTSDTGTEADLDPGGVPVTVTGPPGDADTNGIPGDDGDEPTVLVIGRFPAPVPEIGAEPQQCTGTTAWSQVSFGAGGTGTAPNLTVNTTGFANMSWPASVGDGGLFDTAQFETRANITERTPFLIDRPPLDRGPSNPAGHVPFVDTFTQTFTGETDVAEVRLHWRSLDQIGWSFDPALNPGISWHYLAGSDDVGNAGTAAKPLLIDAIDFDQDGQSQLSAQDTDGRRSADFTIALRSTDGSPITQIVWSLEEDRSSSTAPEGWTFAMEVCAVLPEAELTLVKSVASVDDTNDNGVLGDAGDVVTYDFTVTNTGEVSVAGLALTDDLLDLTNAAMSPAALTPGTSATLTGATYTVTPQNIADGEIENTASVSGSPVATVGGLPDPTTLLLDAAGDALPPVTDVSDMGTERVLNPDGTPAGVDDPAATDSNGIPGDDGDEPTRLAVPAAQPALTLVKSLAGIDDTNSNGVLGDAGDTIRFTFTVSNTGTTSVAGVTVTDQLLDVTDAPTSPDALAPGDSGTLTASYEVTPQNITDGEVVNTATTEGTPVATGPGGVPDPSTPLVDGSGDPLPPATDTSDTGTEPGVNPDGTPIIVDTPETTDSNGIPGDDGDEPTIVSVPAAQAGLVLVKSVAAVADTNANGVLGDAGDTVTYLFDVTNTGNTSLAGLTIDDSLLDLTDAAMTPADILPGGTATLNADYVITPENQADKVVENTAEAAGLAVATGTDGLPDPSRPYLDGSGDPLPAVTDTSDAGTDADVANGTPARILNPEATDSNGTPGDDGDEPTLLNLPGLVSDLSVIKSVSRVEDTNGNGVLADAGDTVFYSFAVTNTGQTSLGNVSITDPLLGLTNAAATPSAIAPGDTATLEDQPYSVTEDNITSGVVENTAVGSGVPVATGPGGVPDPGTPLLDVGGGALPPVSDTSDAGTEQALLPDGSPSVVSDPTTTDSNGTPGDDADEPTLLSVPAAQPAMVVTKSVSNIADTNGNGLFGDAGDVITYAFTVENTGNTSLAGVSIDDPLLGLTDAAVNPADLRPGETGSLVGQTYTVTAEDIASGQVTNTAEGTGQPVATDAGGAPDPTSPIIGSGGPLDPVTDTSDAGTEQVLNLDGTPVVVADPPNTDSNGVPGDDGDEPTIVQVPILPQSGDVTITKVAGVDRAAVGDVIPYTITVTNQTTVAIGPFVLRDTLPEGLVFLPGTGAVDGAPAEPEVEGRVVRFNGLSMVANGSTAVTLSARVTSGAPSGDMVNMAQAFEPISGSAITDIATATVRRDIEPLFECSDIIGKVFDDRDRDGYQDAPAGGLTDDETFVDGKGAAPRAQQDGEPGLAGVRVVTPRGVVITTDEYGRFHVPCAELPRQAGSNFTMKLDTASLPSGYRVTTENPRTIRVTPGKMARLNFGASIGHVVDIDLSARAFAGRSASPALEAGLRQLVVRMDKSVSLLRIAYHQQAGEDTGDVRARLDAVEDLVRRSWRRDGRYRLVIERTVTRGE